MDFMDLGAKISLIFVPFLFAICFHEWAHAWMAKRLGDPTADMMGRLTLNPLAHMDPLGTVVFPMMAIVSGGNFFFGWAKPVPVSTRYLAHPRKDMFWIALAGPASNFFLAFITSLIFVLNQMYIHSYSATIHQIVQYFLIVNLSLAFFNLIPVHPLDGGKILARFLPENWNNWLEDNSQMISFGLLFLIIMDGFSGRGGSFLSYPIMITAQLFTYFWSLLLAIWL